MKKKKSQTSGTFEIDMVIRNRYGDAVGRKSFSTDNAAKLCEFYERNQTINHTSKHKEKKTDLVEIILDAIDGDDNAG